VKILSVVAAALIALILAVAVTGMARSKTKPACTHGVSSIGPITLINGKIVGGSTVPHTEACLP
jgi:H+/gluconate symporter-like permease